MNLKMLLGLVLVCLIISGGCASTSAPESGILQATNTLIVVNLAPFDPDIDITDAVRQKCKLETRLPRATYDIVRKKDLYVRLLLRIRALQ
jgi:hypothetical protein